MFLLIFVIFLSEIVQTVYKVLLIAASIHITQKGLVLNCAVSGLVQLNNFVSLTEKSSPNQKTLVYWSTLACVRHVKYCYIKKVAENKTYFFL